MPLRVYFWGWRPSYYPEDRGEVWCHGCDWKREPMRVLEVLPSWPK